MNVTLHYLFPIGCFHAPSGLDVFITNVVKYTCNLKNIIYNCSLPINISVLFITLHISENRSYPPPFNEPKVDFATARDKCSIFYLSGSYADCQYLHQYRYWVNVYRYQIAVKASNGKYQGEGQNQDVVFQ